VTATCTRFDSAPVEVTAGTLTTIPGSDFSFDCPNCCKFHPVECPANDIFPDPRHCELESGITFTESITLSVSGSVTVSIGAVEAALEAGIGVVVGSEVHVNLTCPIVAPKCFWVGTKPRITYYANRKVRVDHTWTMTGKWISHGCPCPIAGNTWIITNCTKDASYATGNPLINATCGQLFGIPCPPTLPCE